jgi:GNAT superfamily N-acetyltransferase
MNTTFRPANPDDAAFLGWTIVMAARGHLSRGWFDIVLQRPEESCIAFCARLANAEAKSWWHHSFFTIAEVDGTVAAAACAFPDETPYHVSGEAMAEAARKSGIDAAEQAQLWPRGQFIMSATSGEANCWTIENVATRPDFRWRGVATALLRHMIDEMRKTGPSRGQISFLIGNDPAERCYLGCGFAFAEDKTSQDFKTAMGVPGIRRLERSL